MLNLVTLYSVHSPLSTLYCLLSVLSPIASANRGESDRRLAAPALCLRVQHDGLSARDVFVEWCCASVESSVLHPFAHVQGVVLRLLLRRLASTGGCALLHWPLRRCRHRPFTRLCLSGHLLQRRLRQALVASEVCFAWLILLFANLRMGRGSQRSINLLYYLLTGILTLYYSPFTAKPYSFVCWC